MGPYQNKGQGQKRPYEAAKPCKLFEASKIDETNYVDLAERVITAHKALYKKITTTQMRNLFGYLTVLREELRTKRCDTLDADMISQVQYSKLRFVYAAGRDQVVKDFMEQSQLIACLDKGYIGSSAARFELVCKYMEALVAYHKYHIGQ